MSSISVKQEPGGEGETARGASGSGTRVLVACKEEPGISTEWMEHVKEEPTYLDLDNAGSCMEAAALAGQYTDHASSCTEAAALAGLYTDHAVKDQLVLALESIQHPKGASFSGFVSLEPACVKQEAAVKPEPAWQWEESEPEWEGLASAWEGPDGKGGPTELLFTKLVCVKMEEFADAAEWGKEGERGGGAVRAGSQSETNTREVKQASQERLRRRPLPRPPLTPPAPRPPDYTFAHSCPHCGKGFRNQFVFTRHLFTHKTLQPNKTQHNNLNKTQSKPLKCSHCKFKSRDALVWRQHQSLHDHDVNKGTKFRCESCDFTCGRRTELQRHSKSLHDRLTCNTCCYTTRRVTTLRRHQANCHPAPA